jgi:hypothetical protein
MNLINAENMIGKQGNKRAPCAYSCSYFILAVVAGLSTLISFAINFSPQTIPILNDVHESVIISSMWDRYNSTQKQYYIQSRYNGWNYYNTSVSTGEFDPVQCKSPLWEPGVKSNSNTSMTFVFGITQLQRPYIKDVVRSIAMLRRVSDIDISILVLKSASGTAAMVDLELKTSTFQRTKIYVVENPVDANKLSRSLLKALRYNPNCCGVDEFVRLHVFSLPYDKAIFLDLDIVILKPIDHLFYCNMDFMYAGGLGSPLNAGMFVARANRPDLLLRMVQTLYRVSHTYSQETCFDSLGCGPCKCGACRVQDKHGPRCHGQEGPQGFLHYFFVKRIQHAANFPPDGLNLTEADYTLSLKVGRISSCVYDYQNFPPSHCDAEWAHNGATGTAVSPYVIHKGGDWAKKMLLDPLAIAHAHINKASFFSAQKPCAPEFWILGTRKGGTTAMYTWMTEHPQVARLHIENKPTDGEVGEPISRQNLGRYNAHFRNVEVGKLKGDSKVSRLINDAKTMVDTCGLLHVKFIALLRDPIERAVSNMLMRARLGTAGMNMESNISAYIEKDLELYEDAVRRNPQWDSGINPGHLAGWQSSKNSIYEGLYAVHLRRWFLFAGVDRIRIYFTEHFGQHTAAVVADALLFVGADMGRWDGSSRRFDKNKAPNSRPMGASTRAHGESVTGNSKTSPPQERHHLELSPVLRNRLQDIFGPYNRMLERLLNTTTPWGY